MENEKKIISSLKEGREEAYKYIYLSYYKHLCSYAAIYVKDRYISETIVGDVIFEIWVNRKEIEIHSLKNYLFKAVKNRCINQINQEIRQSELKSRFYNQSVFEHSHDADEAHSLTQLYEKELETKLQKSLLDMPNLTSKIFKLSRFSNLKYNEIAEELGVSVDTVKYHIKSALLTLRRDLKDFIPIFYLIYLLF